MPLEDSASLAPVTTAPTVATAPAVATFVHPQRLAGIGLRLPARMTVLPLGAGALALVSPIPIDDALAARLAELGEVRFLIAPNLLHHLYLGEAIARYPQAEVLGPVGLAAKRPDLRLDHAFAEPLPAALAEHVDVVPIAGIPALQEAAFFHRATRTLVLTDFVFHVLSPEGWVTSLVLRLVGCHGRLAQSRAIRMLVKDREATAESVRRLLALPFETLIPAHGEIVEEHAHARLSAALGRYRAALPALPIAAARG